MQSDWPLASASAGGRFAKSRPGHPHLKGIRGFPDTINKSSLKGGLHRSAIRSLFRDPGPGHLNDGRPPTWTVTPAQEVE
jgi:hypothetical protein